MPDPKRTAEDGYDFTARWFDHPVATEEFGALMDVVAPALMADAHTEQEHRRYRARDVGGPNGARPALDRERERLRRTGPQYVPPVRSGCHRRALGLVAGAVALAALIIRRKR